MKMEIHIKSHVTVNEMQKQVDGSAASGADLNLLKTSAGRNWASLWFFSLCAKSHKNNILQLSIYLNVLLITEL